MYTLEYFVYDDNGHKDIVSQEEFESVEDAKDAIDEEEYDGYQIVNIRTKEVIEEDDFDFFTSDRSSSDNSFDDDDELKDIQKANEKSFTDAFSKQSNQRKRLVEQLTVECFGLLKMEYNLENTNRIKRIEKYVGESVTEEYFLDHGTENEKLLFSMSRKDTFAGLYLGYTSYGIHLKK